VQAVGILLRRIASELFRVPYIEALHPIRQPRGRYFFLLGFHWSMIISTGMRAPQMQHWQLVA